MNVIKCFSASITMIYILHFVNVVYHIYCFDVEHPRDNSDLTMLYNPFNVLLNSVCFYLVENFCIYVYQRSVQFSCSVMSDSLWSHGLQHTRLPCPSPTPRAYSNSCALNQWCRLTISSSAVPFSSCLQSFPAPGSFQTSQFFASGGQNTGVSASASVLPMNIEDLFPLGWTGSISLLSKGLSRVFFNTIVQKHQVFGTQLSLQSNSHTHIWLLEKPNPWLNRPLWTK